MEIRIYKNDKKSILVSTPSLRVGLPALREFISQFTNSTKKIMFLIDDVEIFIEHLNASYLVLQKKRGNSKIQFSHANADLFTYLYPTPEDYESALNSCFNEIIVPYLKHELKLSLKQEYLNELDNIERQLMATTTNSNDPFTEVSNLYKMLVNDLITKKRDWVNTSKRQFIARDSEEPFNDDVKVYDPLSFLKGYVDFFYIGYKKLWKCEHQDEMTFDNFLEKILERKKTETVEALIKYLANIKQSETKNELKEFFNILDNIYVQGLKAFMPPEHLNVFWNVYLELRKKYPAERYPYNLRHIQFYNPFFSNEFLQNVIEFKTWWKDQEQKLFVTSVSIPQLKDFMEGRHKGVPELKVGMKSGAFYYFLFRCMEHKANFIPAELEQRFKIIMIDDKSFEASNYTTWLSRSRINKDTAQRRNIESKEVFNEIAGLFR